MSRGTLRRHLWRAALRVAVLVSADGLAYVAAREVLRAIRDHALLGSQVALLTAKAIPGGSLGGWPFVTALLVGLAVTRNYGRGDLRREPARLLAGVAMGTGLSVWHSLWILGAGAVALQFAASTVGIWAFVLLERQAIDSLVARFLPRARQAERVVFVGDPDDPVGASLRRRAVAGGEMVSLGWITTNGHVGDGVLGKAPDVWEVLNTVGPDTVMLCGRLPDELFETVVGASLAAGCRLLAVPRYEGLSELRPGLISQRGLSLVELTTPSLRARELLVKRAIDLLSAAVGLVLLSPLLALIALAIRLDSPGPVLFRQERVGLGGRFFWMQKFRTMYHGVSDAAHRNYVMSMLRGDERGTARQAADGQAVFKLVGDRRITRVGRFLRRTSLDELPQLVNVLLGQMSLVGPRPPLPYEFDAYDHWQFDRLRVRPGITGLWQVSGRNRLSYREMCQLDVEYIRRWSLWLDFKIMLKTVPVALLNTGGAE